MEAKLTSVGKTKLLRARAGEIVLPKISGFAFGTGGTDGGVVKPAGNTMSAEFLRKSIDNYEIGTDSVKYYCALSGSEANGKMISEIGLYDSDGDIIMIANFTDKGKDEGITMRFEIIDTI